MSLADKQCIPCQGGVLHFTSEQVAEWLKKVDPAWKSIDDKKISRQLELKNFKEVIALVNKIADLAESQGHHPNLNIHEYKNLTITIYTHKINGLWDSDFILAAKIDKLINEFK